MALEEASKETARLKTVRTKLKPLHERHDTDYNQWRLDEFTIPVSEGNWESFTDNKPKEDGDRMTEEIAFSKRKLWIELDIDAKDSKERKSLSAVEHLAIGVIGIVDRAFSKGRDGGTVQSRLAWSAVHRGATVKRYILKQGDDNKLEPKLDIWDIRNTFMIPGTDEWIWVCLEDMASPEAIQKAFPDWKGTYISPKDAAGKNDIAVDYIYDNEEEGVIVNGEYVQPKEKHGLDYIPVHIRPCGSTPLIFDDNTDNIKDWGESYLASNRRLNEDYNRAMCYLKTRAGELAKPIRALEYDSMKGGKPVKLGADPKKGDTISVDVGKGQKVGEYLVPASGTDIGVFLQIVAQARDTGGLSDIAKGILNQTQTAQGLDIAYHAAMAKLRAPIQCVQLDLIWIAEETAKQFKDGKFTETELQGVDNNGKVFTTSVKHDQINENWEFSCILSPNLLRDIGAQIANVKVLTEGDRPITSIETGRDLLPFIDDTDLEAEKVSKEQARALMGIGELEAFFALFKDWRKSPDPEKQFILEEAFKKLTMALSQQGAPGGTTQSAQPQPGNRQIAGQGNVHPEVVAAARGRQGNA